MYTSPATSNTGGIAKWPKATVCKTVIRGFKSHSRLFHKKAATEKLLLLFYSLH